MNRFTHRVVVAAVFLWATGPAFAADVKIRPEITPASGESTITIHDADGANCTSPPAGFCGNCSITCPTGKAAICKPGLAVGNPSSPQSSCIQPPECSCR